ncbi:MAG TPA: hypothetical protein VM241_06640 [Candidatus Thermoplasmatota archaeon]|nr:hypothetical protein [Candidatus Thermoplasmatota archaeon]
MRWLLTLLGVLLLVWLASGDARAQGWRRDAVAERAPPDIQAVVFGNPSPGVVGAWVQLAPTACSERVIEARFLYAGDAYAVRAPLPPCPSPPVFLGRALPAPPPGVRPEVTHAYVVEREPYTMEDNDVKERFPAGGRFLPVQAVALPAGPLPALAWTSADVGAVGGLWALAWWRDPSRAVRAPSFRPSPGR